MTPAVAIPKACSLLFLPIRCVGVCLVDTRRVGIRIGGAAEWRVTKAIASAPERHVLALASVTKPPAA
jgi:hypothetical protein